MRRRRYEEGCEKEEQKRGRSQGMKMRKKRKREKEEKESARGRVLRKRERCEGSPGGGQGFCECRQEMPRTPSDRRLV